jgi:DNA adenine methylase
VEPFFGSGAALLCRPQPFSGSETVNDYDGLVANFWRALQAVPDEVAHWADWPVNENDLHARHVWLVERKDPLQAKLEGDPEYYDAKIAGWWVWGMAAWIGSGFCSGKGPWGVVEEDGCRQLVHLGDAGRGVKRQLVELEDYFQQLADRLRHVRVCCGDWSRVMGDSVTRRHGKAAILLDPPYSHAVRDNNLYRVEDDCAAAVRKWCAANGDDKQLRIALCGYAGEGHEELEEMGWRVLAWKASGGYESQGKERTGNAAKERIWFSPHCLQVESPIVPSRVDPVRIESTRSLFDAP